MPQPVVCTPPVPVNCHTSWVRFGLLGPLVATGDDGAPVDLGRPGQRAVLALLVLDINRVVSAERLIDDLWSGEPPARPAGALHAYVSNLRRVLEPHRLPRSPATVLVSQSPGYVLRAGSDDVDWVLFERLAVEGHRLVESDLVRRSRSSTRPSPCGAAECLRNSPARGG